MTANPDRPYYERVNFLASHCKGLCANEAADRRPSRRKRLEPGECPSCDREREAGNSFHPSHDASERCESGKHPHCTCDTCF